MLVRVAEGKVFPLKGAGRSSTGFFAHFSAAFTSFMGGELPSAKNRSWMSPASVASSGGLSHIFLPSRMVLACLPMDLTPSSGFMEHMPFRVWCTRSMFPALKSKFSHCSASESSEEFSESSVFVAAVAANKFVM